MRPRLSIAMLVLAAAACESTGEDRGGYPCHYDCGGGLQTCEDGVVTTSRPVAVPCDEWRGACPPPSTYPCARGCRTDGVTANASFEAPWSLCEESRPKSVGDRCTTAVDCQPARELPGDGGIDRPVLACDPSTSRCVDVRGAS